MLEKLRIATRESALAMWQAHYVRDRIRDAFPDLDVEICGMTTQGDRDKTSPLSRIGGKGVFIKELEQALLSGNAEIAVHSMKDVPAELPSGLGIAAICEREDPRDAFVSNQYSALSEMPAGAKVGTSSLRRRLQLQAQFPDLVFPELRGNVDTRLRKLDEGEYDAIILATAGLKRLGLGERIRERIDPELCIPAAGQGAVGIECVTDNEDVMAVLGKIDHGPTSLSVRCERMISIGLGATCNLPIAGYARVDDGEFVVTGYVASTDGASTIRVERRGDVVDASVLSSELVAELLDRGGRALVEASEH